MVFALTANAALSGDGVEQALITVIGLILLLHLQIPLLLLLLRCPRHTLRATAAAGMVETHAMTGGATKVNRTAMFALELGMERAYVVDAAGMVEIPALTCGVMRVS
mmetsp:Transcript_19847/g.34171  ORF Transcript_19847/g.34171 Transcript_19847/m.34171 type:complete len:107 (+) Transcript_19847:776-1096(+)